MKYNKIEKIGENPQHWGALVSKINDIIDAWNNQQKEKKEDKFYSAKNPCKHTENPKTWSGETLCYADNTRDISKTEYVCSQCLEEKKEECKHDGQFDLTDERGIYTCKGCGRKTTHEEAVNFGKDQPPQSLREEMFDLIHTKAGGFLAESNEVADQILDLVKKSIMDEAIDYDKKWRGGTERFNIYDLKQVLKDL